MLAQSRLGNFKAFGLTQPILNKPLTLRRAAKYSR